MGELVLQLSVDRVKQRRALSCSITFQELPQVGGRPPDTHHTCNSTAYTLHSRREGIRQGEA